MSVVEREVLREEFARALWLFDGFDRPPAEESVRDEYRARADAILNNVPALAALLAITVDPSEPTGWTAEQWRDNAAYWYSRAQDAIRARDFASLCAEQERTALLNLRERAEALADRWARRGGSWWDAADSLRALVRPDAAQAGGA